MPLATMSDAVREYARNVGSERPDQAWILSPYDTWERNPCYSGPPQPHPEEYDSYEDDEALSAALEHADPLDPNAYPHLLDPRERELERAARRRITQARPSSAAPAAPTDLYDDDLPF